MRIVRMVLVAVAVLAGATACNNSDSDDKSLPPVSVSVSVRSAGEVPAQELGDLRARGLGLGDQTGRADKRVGGAGMFG